MKIIFLFIVAWVFSGCMTEQKAVDLLTRTGRLPVICATKYPPVLGPVKPGKPITVRDTTYLPGESVPCPPGGVDTLYIKCPPTKVIRDTTLIHDTVPVYPNPDQINGLLDQLGSKENENIYLKQSAQDTQKRANTYLISLIASISILVIAIVYIIKKTVL